jgi:hypothetical protein
MSFLQLSLLLRQGSLGIRPWGLPAFWDDEDLQSDESRGQPVLWKRAIQAWQN